MRQIFLEGRPLHIFPCRADKHPCTPHGHLDAVSDAASIAELWARYHGPLVGVATGAIGGIAVLDIDPNGESWFHAHRDQLPQTRTHSTRREGWHFIYNNVPGLRCSNSKIAPGVDIKAEGGYVIWWPAVLGRVLCEGPVAPFPVWVAAGGMGTTSKSGKNGHANGHAVVPIPPDRPPTVHEINYAKRALGNACYELNCHEARNDKTNALAYSMGRLIVRGWIPCARVEDYLLRCCAANGLLVEDGLAQCLATIRSGINAGMKRPYQDIG